MDTLSFRWSAKYGHFLRAEANVNALSYPTPPRTAVLGMLAAILGLEKDALVTELTGIRVAVSGPVPARFWHRVKLRKDPPTALPWEVKRNQRGTDHFLTAKFADCHHILSLFGKLSEIIGNKGFSQRRRVRKEIMPENLHNTLFL